MMDKIAEAMFVVFCGAVLVILVAMGWAIVKPGLIDSRALGQMQQAILKEMALQRPVIQNQGTAIAQLRAEVKKLQKPKEVE